MDNINKYNENLISKQRLSICDIEDKKNSDIFSDSDNKILNIKEFSSLREEKILPIPKAYTNSSLDNINNNNAYQKQQINNNNISNVNNNKKMNDRKLIYTLRTLDLENLFNDFNINMITFNDIFLLSKDDLIEMKIPIGPRNRILHFAEEYKKFAKNYDMEELVNFFNCHKCLIINSMDDFSINNNINNNTLPNKNINGINKDFRSIDNSMLNNINECNNVFTPCNNSSIINNSMPVSCYKYSQRDEFINKNLGIEDDVKIHIEPNDYNNTQKKENNKVGQEMIMFPFTLNNKISYSYTNIMDDNNKNKLYAKDFQPKVNNNSNRCESFIEKKKTDFNSMKRNNSVTKNKTTNINNINNINNIRNKNQSSRTKNKSNSIITTNISHKPYQSFTLDSREKENELKDKIFSNDPSYISIYKNTNLNKNNNTNTNTNTRHLSISTPEDKANSIVNNTVSVNIPHSKITNKSKEKMNTISTDLNTRFTNSKNNFNNSNSNSIGNTNNSSSHTDNNSDIMKNFQNLFSEVENFQQQYENMKIKNDETNIKINNLLGNNSVRIMGGSKFNTDCNCSAGGQGMMDIRVDVEKDDLYNETERNLKDELSKLYDNYDNNIGNIANNSLNNNKNMSYFCSLGVNNCSFNNNKTSLLNNIYKNKN